MPEVFSTKKKKKRVADKTAHEKVQTKTLANDPACDSAFAAFAPKPSHHFESQAHDERIILALRRHPITNLPWILLTVVLFFFPVFINILPIGNFLPGNFRFMVFLGWYLLLLGFVIENFLSWFFNLNVITDERIIDIDFDNLIYKRVSSAKIENIEDVTSSTGGFIRSLLSFGTVLVQTAAEEKEFEFTDIPQPEKVVKLLNELILEEEREKLEGRVS